MGTARHNPWRELRARPHIIFALERLPWATGGAIFCPVGAGRAVIVIDPVLTRRERADALTHELVHDERGGIQRAGLPAWGAERIEAWDESIVRREVARRRVPPDELLEWIQRVTADDCQAVTAELVAEEFDVSVDVAETAVASLASLPPAQEHGQRRSQRPPR